MKLLVPIVAIVAALIGAVMLDSPPPRAELVFVNRGEIFTLDPQRMSYLQDFRMAYAMYEGLVRWDNSDFTIEPAGAESWEISPDKTQYTFHLRDDARWSNGDPLTAHDFVFSWMRALLPDTAADYSNLFFAIDGSEDFFHWRNEQLAAKGDRSAEELWAEAMQRFDETVGLKAIDDRTLQVRLERPVAYFLDLLAFGVYYPVHRPTVEGWDVDEHDRAVTRKAGWRADQLPSFADRAWVKLDDITGRYEQQHNWTKPHLIVTNGPYVLDDWRYKRGARLVKNERYHSPEKVRAESVATISIDDPNTAVLAFESGEIDWLSDVNVEYQADMLAQRTAYEQRHAAQLQKLLDSGLSIDEALAQLPEPESGERRNIHVFPTFGTDFYSFNCRPELPGGRFNPFADAQIRRAFVMSVNREAIVESVTRLNEPVATAFIPPGSIPGYEVPEGLGYDTHAARAELKAAGWEDRDGDGFVENEAGEPFPTVEILYTTSTPRYKGISIVLKDMWERELGVPCELKGKETKFYKDDLKHGNFMIARGRWYGDYGDPTTFLDLCKSTDGNNDRGYKNDYVDGLLEQAANESDPEKRMEILQECERFLFQEEVPMLVLCQLVQLYMYEPGELEGLSTHPRLVQYLWQMEVVEE